MSTASAVTAAPYGGGFRSGFTSWPRRAEAFLDSRGRGAWIAAMVLAFIVAWPVGLALLFYIIFIKRRRNPEMFGRNCAHRRHSSQSWGPGGWSGQRPYGTTGNSAFDAYRAEMLKRLEDEQAAFESFLGRLREAKDKQEFDAFMQERARLASVQPQEGDTPAANA